MGGFFSALFLVVLARLAGDERVISRIRCRTGAQPWAIFLGAVLGCGAIVGIAVFLGGLAKPLVSFSVLKWLSGAAIVLVGLSLAFGKRAKREEPKSGVVERAPHSELSGGSGESPRELAGGAGLFFASFVLAFSTEIVGKALWTTAAIAARYDAGLPVFFGSLTAMVISSALFVLQKKGTSMGSRLKGIRSLSAIAFLAFGISIFLASPEMATKGPGEEASLCDAIANFRKINDQVYAGARPGEEGVGRLGKMGIRAIVNLECGVFDKEPHEVEEEKRWAEKHGIKFYAIPMHPLLAPREKDVDKAIRLMTDPVNQPVFVHCHEGKDRTGVVIAAYRIRVDGWSRERAYEEMKKYGFHRALFWWKRSFSRERGTELARSCRQAHSLSFATYCYSASCVRSVRVALP
jgi:putative Ca2+/H+ antiporter (TMEM165/GDT1 family)/protein tyrosine phosphatase (PTP) superfamily phosphohydrolase (DUF442 family)